MLPSLVDALYRAWEMGVGKAKGRIMSNLSFFAAVCVIWKEKTLDVLRQCIVDGISSS